MAKPVSIFIYEPNHQRCAAGLRVNDLIVTINQEYVESVDDLHRFLAEWPIGQPVEIDVIRGQQRQILKVTPQEAGV